jgi:hypothetical protein
MGGDSLKINQVAKSAAGLDQVLRAGLALAEFRADRLHVGVDRAVGDGARIVPRAVEQLIAGEYAARLAEEHEEEFVFVGGEIERATVAVDAHRGGVVMEWSGGGWRGRRGRIAAPLRATQDRPDAGDDFAGRKGFGHIVVAAELESEDAIDFTVARGEEKHRHGGGFAQGPANIETAHVGQADVEDEEVVRLRGEGVERGVTGQRMSDLEAFGFQGIDERIGDGGFVFDKQDAGHGVISPVDCEMPMKKAGKARGRKVVPFIRATGPLDTSLVREA